MASSIICDILVALNRLPGSVFSEAGLEGSPLFYDIPTFQVKAYLLALAKKLSRP
jgi:hypothetical protein